jgi:hypothetical protein
MKMVFVVLAFSVGAFAESNIVCTKGGGAEAALAVAPEKFQVDEAGSFSLDLVGPRGGTTTLANIEIESEDQAYHGGLSISFEVYGSKKLPGMRKEVEGLQKFSLVGCKNEESTTATYEFSYRVGADKRTSGVATYKCECAID